MKWGVRFSGGRWWVFNTYTNEFDEAHYFEWAARRRAKWLNERGV